MKFIVFILVFVATFAYASEPVCTTHVGEDETKETLEIKTDVPKHLEGAVIIVRQKDGKESVVPAEKFKVVPRKQQFIVTKVAAFHGVTCTTNTPNPNRVSLLGGYGARNGLDTSKSGNKVTAETSTGVVGGAQYQRMLDDTFSVGVQGQTNKSGSLLLGVDF